MQERTPGSWTLWIDLGPDPATGKRRQRTTTFKGTRRQAENHLADLIAQVDKGTFPVNAPQALADYITHWLEWVRPQIAPKTWASYEQQVRLRIMPGLGKARLRKLTASQIDMWCAALLGAGAGRRTVQLAHATLRTALAQAVRWDLLAVNPAKAVKAPKPERREATIVGPGAAAMLLDSLDDTPLKLSTLLALATGLRRGEVLGAGWEHLGPDNLHVLRCMLKVRQGRPEYGPTKTGGSRRAVPLPRMVLEALAQERQRQERRRRALGEDYRDHGLICCREDGSPWDPDAFTKAFRAHVKDHNLPALRFHDLRHSYASLLIAAGEHPKVVSALLGHTQIGITMNLYGHLMPALGQATAATIERALTAGTPVPVQLKTISPTER
jgi:integrase